MADNIINQTPYLRVQRTFPEESQPLSVELDKSYIDIANAVNQRTIGIFSTTAPAITGETWFIGSNRKRSTFRQVYFINGTGNYPHGIDVSKIFGFTRLWGAFNDGAGTSYPLPYVDVTSATNQIAISVDVTNIIITGGAGTPPTINAGQIVLEWLS